MITGTPTRSLATSELPPRLAAAAAPLRPIALGGAVGLVCAVLFALVTAAHLLVLPAEAPHLALLAQYLRGYRVSPAGAVVGAAWGGGLGFVAGWLLAFARNTAVRLWLELVRARASLEKTGFLDGI